ncbi:Hypp9471 [Branchiostoma lanceolatum]|uniref:Hypp9471 protein n=1 Tax=Branchiostoma lanceolatum TaxID=7740 RepID=A0A8S4MMM2_BRALA|nr:Hypp9471 [Branchiostoma lanceolatum]
MMAGKEEDQEVNVEVAGTGVDQVAGEGGTTEGEGGAGLDKTMSQGGHHGVEIETSPHTGLAEMAGQTGKEEIETAGQTEMADPAGLATTPGIDRVTASRREEGVGFLMAHLHMGSRANLVGREMRGQTRMESKVAGKPPVAQAQMSPRTNPSPGQNGDQKPRMARRALLKHCSRILQARQEEEEAVTKATLHHCLTSKFNLHPISGKARAKLASSSGDREQSRNPIPPAQEDPRLQGQGDPLLQGQGDPLLQGQEDLLPLDQEVHHPLSFRDITKGTGHSRTLGPLRDRAVE